MVLQRFDHWAEIGASGLAAEVVAVESCDGEYYLAADVDALLARIRAAVEAEREAETRHVCATSDDSPVTTGGGPTYHTSRAVTATRAALDALLADGGA